MQFKIRKLSHLSLHPDFRWDSQYLSCEPYKNEKLQYTPIGNTLISSQYGVSIEMNEDNIGTKIYRMNEISNMLCDPSILKHAELSDSQIASYKLEDRDVLFNRTNSKEFVGRTGIFKKFSDENIVFASYLVRINPDPEIVTPEYLTAFLNTKYGIIDIKRRARHSVNQSNVNLEEVKRIEIPLLGNQLQKEITSSFDKAFHLIQSSEKVYHQAQTLLFTELGLADWQPEQQRTFVKNFSDTERAGRIDADYFQPKYDEIEKGIENYSNRSNKIKNEFKQNKSTFEVDPEKLYRYVEIGSVNVSTGEIVPEEVLGKDLPANAKRVLKKGDVIISKVRTYRGAITIVREDGYVGSGAFCVLSENGQVNKETLLACLRSKLFLTWSWKPNTGTSYPTLNDDDILDFPIPILPKEKQVEMQQKVDESFSLHKHAKDLLEYAKRAVEIAIEQDEQTAINWLKSVSQLP
ncbi:hypothetical protein F4X88_03865 [Candidatus Poribacteria bacterium]|nr:hypothetical protein [Candidatus Poribacteria bacterium]